MIITEKTSRTISVANLITIIMIISIHYSTQGDIVTQGEVLGWNYLVQEFLTSGLARVGVPYFALISGFFLFSQFAAHCSYPTVLKSRFRTLLVPYLSAATVIFLSIALAKWFKGDTSLLTIQTLFQGIVIRPISGQFWFLRDLILLVVVSPLLFPPGRFLRLALGLCLFMAWLLNWQILPTWGDWYVINIETLLFFYLGGQLSGRSDILNTLVTARTTAIASNCFFWVSLTLLRVYVDPTLDLWYAEVEKYSYASLFLYKAAIVIGVVCLIQISSLLWSSNRLIYLSGLSFFAFLFHFVPLNFLITRLSETVVAREYGFYLSFPAATITVFTLAHMIATYIPTLYRILCGGRTPHRAFLRSRQCRPG
jgi:hypothetical protein